MKKVQVLGPDGAIHTASARHSPLDEIETMPGVFPTTALHNLGLPAVTTFAVERWPPLTEPSHHRFP